MTRGKLSDLRALLIDMDGVLWVGDRPLPGVSEFFRLLETNRIQYILVSNNATRRAGYTVERLARMGIPVSAEHVLTSADATPLYLTRKFPALKRVYVVGETALRQALQEAGIEIVAEGADAVVVGLDRDLRYESLRRAALEIRRGARFIATNTDRTLPTEARLVPGAGSIVAALEAATDVQPLIIGKPGRPMFELALDLMQTPPGATAMLGDRLDTDIDGAAQLGIKTILVLTGVSTRDEARAHPIQPDFIFDDLPQLVAAWSAQLRA